MKVHNEGLEIFLNDVSIGKAKFDRKHQQYVYAYHSKNRVVFFWGSVSSICEQMNKYLKL